MDYPYPRPSKVKTKVKKGISGLGLFAEEPIKKGIFVIEYFGPIISEEAANQKGGKYLFELDAHKTIFGASRKNIARYVNHSCKPNCEAIQEGDRIFIYTKRTIERSEERTYNNGKEYLDDHIKPVGCCCDACST